MSAPKTSENGLQWMYAASSPPRTGCGKAPTTKKTCSTRPLQLGSCQRTIHGQGSPHPATRNCATTPNVSGGKESSPLKLEPLGSDLSFDFWRLTVASLKRRDLPLARCSMPLVATMSRWLWSLIEYHER